MQVLFKDKIWDRDAVIDLLSANDLAVGRALMVIYENQTADEKQVGLTKHNNGIGFNGQDGEWLSDIALKWKRWGRWASSRQCAAVRKAMMKYHRQILQSMIDKQGAVPLTAREAKLHQAQPDYADMVIA